MTSSFDYGPDDPVPNGETSMVLLSKPVYVANKIRKSFVFQIT